jgi:hypothetical protein
VFLAERARCLAGQQQAVVGVHERRHQRKVHQQDLHEQRRAAEEGHVGQCQPARAALSAQASGTDAGGGASATC